MKIEDLAKEIAGNYCQFDSFAWGRLYDIPYEEQDSWGIVYTSNRDSGLMTRSNESVINRVMEPFTEGDNPDVVMERHNHWAVGYVNGFSVRVYRDGEITPAFRAYFDLVERMNYYSVLDDDDYYQREEESTIENIRQAEKCLEHSHELPDNWEYDVYSWLSNKYPNELESVDDAGGWPSDEKLMEAFNGLNYPVVV